MFRFAQHDDAIGRGKKEKGKWLCHFPLPSLLITHQPRHSDRREKSATTT